MEEEERMRLAELEEDISPGEKCERAMQAAINEAEAEVRGENCSMFKTLQCLAPWEVAVADGAFERPRRQTVS